MNVVYSVGGLLEWKEVALSLKEKLNWIPKYWITTKHNHDQISKSFSNILIHPFEDLNRCVLPKEYEDLSLNQPVLDERSVFKKYETTIMELFDRMDLGGSFTYEERQRVYLKLLVFWLNIVEKKKLKIIIFNSPPHSVGEYIAYVVFKVKKLQIRIYRPSNFNNFHFICDEIESLPKTLKNSYNLRLKNQDSKLKVETIKYLNQDIEKLGAKPWYLHQVVSLEKKRHAATSRIEELFNKNMLIEETFKIGKPLEYICDKENTNKKVFPRRKITEELKLPVNPIFKLAQKTLSDSYVNKWEFVNYRDWAYVKKLRIKKKYDEITLDYKKNEIKNYVYFPMQYQPERTTCPDGGKFSNQISAISLIANSLPKNWSLVVKEHPSQFNYLGFGEQSRREGYYDNLLKLKNIKFAPLNTSSLELIKNSKAVATITGQAGWESLLNRIPVLCLGTVWYGLCHGVFKVNNAQDVNNAFLQIKNGYKIKKKDIEMYVGALEDISEVIFSQRSLIKNDLSLDKPEILKFSSQKLSNLMIQFEQY